MKQTLYYIYQITNLLNGKIYVGAHSTTNLDDGYLGSGLGILRAIKKYGPENFRKDILSFYDSYESLFQEEAKVVNELFVKRKDTYNLAVGGKGWKSDIAKEMGKMGGTKSYFLKRGFHNLTPEKILQRTIKKRHLKTCAAFNEALREQHRLKTLTLEARRKRIQSFQKIGHAQGSKNSQFGKIWITNGIINQKLKKEDEIPEGFWKGRIIKRK